MFKHAFRFTALLLCAALPVLRSSAAQAQRETERDAFTWSGVVPQGRWIRVQNLNGGVTVRAGTGDHVEVRATKEWRRSNPAIVHFDVQKVGGNGQDILICALWGDNARCDEDGYRGTRDRDDRELKNNDVSVDFQVLVPRGVKVAMKTVNGTVLIDGATSEVDAYTVNGGVDVTTSGGPVNAKTINGNVRARVGRLEANNDRDMSFATINGSVTAEFIDDVSGDVELSTVNGHLRTDYPITITGRLDPRHLRTHIGAPGGPRIRLSTVNGSVEMRKR